MDGFRINGDNSYANCQVWSSETSVNALTGQIQVQAGVPALYACICDPDTGACPDVSKVGLTVTAPDGTVYNQDTNTATAFVKTVSGKLYVMCILQPAAGNWTMTCRTTAPVSFRANLQTVPAGDPVGSVIRALQPRYSTDQVGAALIYQIFRWGYWPAAALLAAAAATSGLAMNLKAFIGQLFGLTDAQAQQILTLIANQTVDGTVTTCAQQTGNVSPDVSKQILANGAATNGLTGWTILANGGAGWAVQSGYSNYIGCPDNFAASYAWCKKSQSIDLLQAGGLGAQYLDQAPAITVTDWVAAVYPAGATQQSQYYLLVRLLDANQNVLKEFQTGNLSLAATGSVDGQLAWLRTECTFANYGAGARYVYFEHGGLDPQQWDRQYGVKLTDASVDVQLALPYQPAELIQNGNGQNGLTGWTATGDPWTAETGPAVACPGMTGKTNFAVASGSGQKSQSVDLVSSGYSAAFLDNAPMIQVAQWVASSPDCACSYTLKVELRNQDQGALMTFDTGTLQVPVAANVAFRRVTQNLSGYGTGLRYIYFEHCAAPATSVSGKAPAKITGASAQFLAPPPTSGSDSANAPAPRAAEVAQVGATPVPDTTKKPYYWSSLLDLTARDHAANVDRTGGGSGWLTPKSGNQVMVLTAAHCFYVWELNSWVSSVKVTPGAAGTTLPYGSYTARGTRLQMPLEFLTQNQGTPGADTLNDYGAVVVDATGLNWVATGFTPTPQQDNQFANQAASVTGYPYGESGYQRGNMYSEDITVSPINDTYVRVQTNFRGGASGSPVYVKGTSDAVGIFSSGAVILGLTFNYLTYGTRITDKVLQDVTRWSTLPSSDDRVCKFQMVIRTGDVRWAGAGSPVKCTIDGHDYALCNMWMDSQGGRGQENQRGHWDGYDLSAEMQKNYPSGLFLRDLVGKTYSLTSASDWNVETVVIFVNDRLLCAETQQRWVLAGRPPWDVVTGTIRLQL